MATGAAAAKATSKAEQSPVYTQPITGAEIAAYIEALGMNKHEFAGHWGAGHQTVHRWTVETTDPGHPGGFRLAVWALALMHGRHREVGRVMREHGVFDHSFRKTIPKSS